METPRVRVAVRSFENILEKRKAYEAAMAHNARLVIRLNRDEFAEYARQTNIIQERDGA